MDTIELNNIVIFQEADQNSLSPIIGCLKVNHEVISIELDYDAVADEIRNLKDLLYNRSKKFVLIAHSYNAFTAILYAKAYGKLIKHLILLGCPPFDKMYAVENPQMQKSKIFIELSELRDQGKLIDAIKNVRCPITFIHGKQDINLYEGVLDVLNDNDVDFEFILMDNCSAEPWNVEEESPGFLKMLKVLVDEF